MATEIIPTDDHLQIKEKHEKLQQDYTKQRNKLVILKKAYLELNEQTTQKDQLIRKYEQEIESLNFRNKQLVTRISLLQQDTTIDNNNTSTSSILQNNILKEEFERKINENAYLHQQLHDIETSLSEKCKYLQSNIDDLVVKNSDLQKLLDTHERKCVDYACKLEECEDKLNFFTNLNNLNENFIKIFNLFDEKLSILMLDDYDNSLIRNLCKNFLLNKNYFQTFINLYLNLNPLIISKELTQFGNLNEQNEKLLNDLNVTHVSHLNELKTFSPTTFDVSLKGLLQNLNEILIIKHQCFFKQNLLTIDECLVFYLQKNLSLFLNFYKYFLDTSISTTHIDVIGDFNKCVQFIPEIETPNTTTDDFVIVKNNDELETYYKTQMDNLTQNLDYVSSKAICLNDELSTYKNLFNLNDSKMKQCQNENNSLNLSINKLNDELETVSRHYEDQLRAMSEHIAELNERLTQQNDMLEKLSSQQMSSGTNSSRKLLSKKAK